MGERDGRPVAIVAGASSGMGRATALGLVADEFRVVAAARSDGKLAELTREAAAAGGEIHAVTADATVRADCEALVSAAVDRFGGVDVLVNTVGLNLPDRLVMELTDETWRGMIDGNLTAAFNLTQAVIPHFRERGGGLLIHIASVAALRAEAAAGVAYQAAKAGVAALAHGTMEEERDHGVRVTVIYPGLVDTQFVKFRASPPNREVLDRALRADDIATACRFVAGLPAHVWVPDLPIAPAARV